MNNEEQLRQALNYISNNWRGNPLLREAFGSVFTKLNEGTELDLLYAKVIDEYLSYPGSDAALASVDNLHKALNTQQGRQAVKLDPKKRANKYPVETVKVDDPLMQIMVAKKLNKAKEFDVEAEVLRHFGSELDKRTIKWIIEQLEPRSNKIAELIIKIFKAKEKQKPPF